MDVHYAPRSDRAIRWDLCRCKVLTACGRIQLKLLNFLVLESIAVQHLSNRIHILFAEVLADQNEKLSLAESFLTSTFTPSLIDSLQISETQQ